MKSKLIFFLFFNFFASIVFSQKAEKFDYEFLGVLMLNKTQLYSYKLEFNIDKDSIRGYSYTDIEGDNETKSYVFGTFDENTNELVFEEKDVLYTKSDVLTDEFCFIKSRGKLKLRSAKKSFDSDFEGVYPNGEVCASGKIKIVGTKFVQKKLKKIYKKVKKKKRIDSVVKEKLRPDKILTKFGKTNLNEDETITIFLNKNQAKFEIWDYGKEDGDIVDVYINGKKVLANLKLKTEKKKLLINLKKGSNTIEVKTINSGKIKTNTAKIKIYEANRFYEFLSNINKGKSAKINIVVK
ncbi:hypothetical protein [Tenacibaculum bernardetii]|uniref:hypothetical protein n=1 Tax=Tenacibaculum bernardetii TaxID=3021375 RepID=UPI0023AFC75A|nr:hypothetical protein [Tenacibaculum bernardetii]